MQYFPFVLKHFHLCIITCLEYVFQVQLKQQQKKVRIKKQTEFAVQNSRCQMETKEEEPKVKTNEGRGHKMLLIL